MNPNEQLIHNFYTAFGKNDIQKMSECYHKNIEFQDPAFGVLNKNEPVAMWKMLLEKGKGNIQIDFFDVKANEKTGSAIWVANYIFSQTGRKVVNKIDAKFEFEDGLIIKHTDNFDIYKWSKQALGLKGFLLGWTNFMKNKIQEGAKKSLKNYIEKQS
ncbi:nuclear transport factor 2 family protein [Flavobacterium sp.]|uniref:nuclear transport factor 2 family protein n=1 Tax=Flavobacterium sp. TaxID=239 RepID=UPI00286E449F|nr:nuclear transport factor 2 family protein [Flavobacterium sp.]